MLHWIKKGTRLLAGTVFFIMLANVLVTSGVRSTEVILYAVSIAAGAAILFWFAGFVVCDIILKGLITHIDDSSVDSLIDGGMLQRVRMMQENSLPGGSEMPFTQKVEQGARRTKTGSSSDKG